MKIAINENEDFAKFTLNGLGFMEGKYEKQKLLW
jgi:hypothetical protein